MNIAGTIIAIQLPPNAFSQGYLELDKGPINRLYFNAAPKIVSELLDKKIWGGSDIVMLGQIEIGRHITDNTIYFYAPALLEGAIKTYESLQQKA